MNTRLMEITEYDEKLHDEAKMLRESIPQMEANLRNDPEGCFGGRGNNIGYEIVQNAVARYGELQNAGYAVSIDQFSKLVEANIAPAPIYYIKFNEVERRGNNTLRIGCEPGSRRVKEIKGNEVGVDWIHRDGEWVGQEPPASLLALANTITQVLANVDVMDFRGRFYCPRVYV